MFCFQGNNSAGYDGLFSMNTGVSSFFDLGQINQWNESSTIRSDAQYNVFKFKVYESLSISKTDLAKAQGIKIDSSLSNSNNLIVFWVFYHKTTQLYFPTIFKFWNCPNTLICFRPDIYPDHCGMLNGSAGDFFPSYPEQTFVDLFSPDLCR